MFVNSHRLTYFRSRCRAENRAINDERTGSDGNEGRKGMGNWAEGRRRAILRWPRKSGRRAKRARRSNFAIPYWTNIRQRLPLGHAEIAANARSTSFISRRSLPSPPPPPPPGTILIKEPVDYARRLVSSSNESLLSAHVASSRRATRLRYRECIVIERSSCVRRAT